MKKQNGLTIIELIIAIFIVILIISWPWNAIKLFSCDFKSDYKCEVIHGIGLAMPPLSIVTVLYKDDGE